MNTQEQMVKLENLIKLLSESLTREEFVKSFENVTNFVKKIESNNNAQFQTIQQKFGDLSSGLTKGNSANFEGLKAEANRYVRLQMELLKKTNTALVEQHKQRMLAVDEKLATVQDGKPADETKITEQITEKLKALIPAEKENETGQTIVDKINELPTDDDDDKIDYSHLKNVPKEKKNPSGGSGKYMGGRNIKVDVNIVSLDISIQPTAPDNPVVGMLWIDNS